MKTAKSVGAYMAAVKNAKHRAALRTLRKRIKAVLPRGEECISYGMPAFRLDGRTLVGFAAWADHCSFFPGSYPIAACRNALKGYGTSKGTVRFQPEKPLPATLVRALVKARIAERQRRRRAM